MDNTDRLLDRWQKAGLIDADKAEAIREYEKTRGLPAGQQWQVLVALILGAILLSAGILLFVAAHWEDVSPFNRLLLVLSMLAFFHGIGLLVQQRFAALATAMHALGTISSGAAIALLGQIFNMQEHWPAAVMLWAICAAAGWCLLRDQFQQALALLLIPAWILCEWEERTNGYSGAEIYLARVFAVLAVVYLVAFLHHRKRAVFGILFAAGAILLPVSIALLADGWASTRYREQLGFVPLHVRFAAMGMVLLAVLFGALIGKRSIPPAIVAAALAWALPWAQKVIVEEKWRHSEPNLLAYIMVAGAAVFLVWWGMRIGSKVLVNYGMVAFAATVFWFYFSSVMDKLSRSLGLITLGVLFLAGGWALEQTRRKLVNAMVGGEA